MVIENEQLLTDTFHIKSSNLLRSKNIDGLIKYKMKKIYEKKCSKNGYVIADSLDVVQRSIGKLIVINGESFIQYELNYKIKCIMPCKDDIYECIIDSITRMGIIAYLNYKEKEDSKIKDSPLLIIIPKEYFTDENLTTDLTIGQKIKVKVLDTRVKYMSKQIQVIGEPLF